jgi:hypothetical protein
MPYLLEHDERIGTVLKAWLEDQEGGETVIRVEAEIFLPPGGDPDTLPRGLTIGFMERENHSDHTPIVIGADAMSFDDAALDEMRDVLNHGTVEVAVERQHQLAVFPAPLVMMVSNDAALPLLQGLRRLRPGR